jgi:hypothetical protein
MTVSIVLRAVKGVPLTNTEVDTNFTNLKVGIEEYTASDVLIKLKTVDGAGSGLDADLLDGLNATSSDLVGNSIVSRTAGNFSAGTITATLFIGPINGNVIGNVSGNVTGSAGTVAYTGLTGTPTIWNQNTTGTAAGLSGTLAVASGGTGATDPTDARINLSAATRGANSDITSLTGLLTPLSVSQGGSGASTLSANSVVLGNGTSAVQTVAPGGSGNVLTSNGTSWISGTGTAAALVTTNSYQIKSLGVGTPASGVTGEIRATNNITAYYSDLRLKDVLGNIKSPLEAVLSLNGVIYKGNEVARGYGYTSDSEQVGLIAQEVQKVLPQVVVPAPFDIAQAEDGSEYSKSGENYLTIQYEKLIPLLIEAIKEQQVQISELKKCINQSN